MCWYCRATWNLTLRRTYWWHVKEKPRDLRFPRQKDLAYPFVKSQWYLKYIPFVIECKQTQYRELLQFDANFIKLMACVDTRDAS